MTARTSVDVRPVAAGSTPSPSGRPFSLSSPARCWYRAVTPSSLKLAALVPNTGMSSGRAPNASRLRASWRDTSRRASAAAPALELVDGHHVGEVEHVDLLELRGRAELGCHHVQRDVGEVDDGGVALADARCLHDHQVEPGGPAGGDDVLEAVGQLAPSPGWPASGRTRGRRRWRSSGCGRRAGRRRRAAGSGRRPARRPAACPPGRGGTAGSARRSATTCPSRRCR